MVNKTDADRDNLEQYIDELDALQERKVEMLGSMKHSLKKFKAAREIVKASSGNIGSKGRSKKAASGANKMLARGRRGTMDHLRDLEDVEDFEDLR